MAAVVIVKAVFPLYLIVATESNSATLSVPRLLLFVIKISVPRAGSARGAVITDYAAKMRARCSLAQMLCHGDIFCKYGSDC